MDAIHKKTYLSEKIEVSFHFLELLTGISEFLSKNLCYTATMPLMYTLTINWDA